MEWQRRYSVRQIPLIVHQLDYVLRRHGVLQSLEVGVMATGADPELSVAIRTGRGLLPAGVECQRAAVFFECDGCHDRWMEGLLAQPGFCLSRHERARLDHRTFAVMVYALSETSA